LNAINIEHAAVMRLGLEPLARRGQFNTRAIGKQVQLIMQLTGL